MRQWVNVESIVPGTSSCRSVAQPGRQSCGSVVLAVLVSCSKSEDEGPKARFYQSPMHPWITSDKPGNCTICGMALVPVYEGQAAREAREGVIPLNPRSLDVLAVTTVPVRRLELTKSLRFSGILEDDENIHRVIAAFYDGRIDQIYVEHVGKYVEKGQPLAAIYSPELLYVVREYQDAIRGGNDSVARNSAQRLVQYGLVQSRWPIWPNNPATSLPSICWRRSAAQS